MSAVLYHFLLPNSTSFSTTVHTLNFQARMSDQNEFNQPGSGEAASSHTNPSDVDVSPGIMSLRDMISAGNTTHAEVMNVITEVSSEALDKEVRYSKHCE
jgi:hypothetical protein